MADFLNVRISFEITKPDGADYASTDLNYSNVPYAGVVAMQKIGMGALAQIQALGEANAKPK